MNDIRTDWTVQRATDSTDPVSIAVVEAVASATDREMLSLEPLQSVIDTDALNTLMEDGQDCPTVTFRYAECTVQVGPETIRVLSEVT